MPEPTTTDGGSTRPKREREHRERAAEIAGERGESTLAATNRTVDLDRQRVLDLLHGFERFIRGGGGDHWDSVGGDRHQAAADVRYAIDAVARFPGVDGPPFSEDVALFVHQVGGAKEKQTFRLEATAAGRLTLRALDIEGQPLVVDVDTVAAAERLLRRGVR